MPSFLLATRRIARFAESLAAVAIIIMVFASGASAASSTASVTLAWDKPNSSAVKGYYIYYAPSSDKNAYRHSTPIKINGADKTSRVIEGLTRGVEYRFAATSHDGNGNESDFSKAITYKIPLQKTTHTVKATAGSGGAIDPGGEISVSHGDSLSFSIIPNTGYDVENVNINGQWVGAVSTYTFDPVESSASIHAAFRSVGKEKDENGENGQDEKDEQDGQETDDGKDEKDAESGKDEQDGQETDDGKDEKDAESGKDKQDGQETDDGKDEKDAESGKDKQDGQETDDGKDKRNKKDAENGRDGEKSKTENPVDSGRAYAHPPYEPVILEPADCNVVEYGKPVKLMASVYSHPEGSAHYLSHWQIRRVEMKKPFYEATSEIDLLIHDVDGDLKEGLRYAWRVGFQDIDSGQIAWSEEKTFVVGEKSHQNGALPVEAGRSITDYKMVSFAHWPENACSRKVFGPLLNPNHRKNDYRILAYDANSDWRPSPRWDGGYRNYGDFEVVPGRAYWILSRHGMDLEREGVPVTTTEDIFVELDYNPSNDDGWTMIAVPNDAEYYWGNVEIVVHDDEGEILHGPIPVRQLAEDNPYIDTRLWEWQRRPDASYEVQDSVRFRMQPHGGYWARARAENVSLCFPYDMQVSWANPKAMMNGWFHAGIEWIDEYIMPRPAYANFDTARQEGPPMPAAGLEETPDSDSDKDPDDGDPSSSGGSGGESGCFIRSISGGKAIR